MNVVKPVIPHEVAEAIEEYRRPPSVCNAVIIEHALGTHRLGKVAAAFRSIPFDTLLTALVNGYTVEKSVEELAEEARQAAHDKIRANYAEHSHIAESFKVVGRDQFGAGRCRGYRYGVEETLEALGIKVEGVNA